MVIAEAMVRTRPGAEAVGVVGGVLKGNRRAEVTAAFTDESREVMSFLSFKMCPNDS